MDAEVVYLIVVPELYPGYIYKVSWSKWKKAIRFGAPEDPRWSPQKNQQRHKGPTAQCQAPSVLGNRFCLECSADPIFYRSNCCTLNKTSLPLRYCPPFLIVPRMNPDPTPCDSNSEDQQGACRESTIDSQEDTGLYLYLGKDDFAKHLVTDEELNEREAERLQAQVAIRTLLQQRVPCFSRSAIQVLVDQIDDTSSRINRGEPAESLEFSLRAFDGSTVEMEVETGTIHPNYGGQEVVM